MKFTQNLFDVSKIFANFADILFLTQKFGRMAKANSKVNIVLDSGEHAEAQAPVVVSASRSTDIPAFYADCFLSGCAADIRHGRTRLTVCGRMWRIATHGLSCFGRRTQGHLSPIYLN